MIKVTVIIPSYNHARYIRQTIESVIAQTFSDIELIIIDDCSTDGTMDMIRRLEPECRKRFTSLVIVEKEKNLGVVDSMKTAIAMAQGKFIYPTASDDILKPEAIATLYDFIKDRDDYGLVGGDDELIDADGERIYWGKNREIVYDQTSAKYLTFADFLKKSRPDVDFSSHDYGSYKSLLRGNYIPNGFLWRALAAKNAAKGLKNGFLEDWYMGLQVSKKYKLKYIDKILYSYRWHQDNAVKDLVKVLKSAYLVIKNEGSYCFGNRKLLTIYTQNRLRYFAALCKYAAKEILFRWLINI